jgi:hypothetical protein
MRCAAAALAMATSACSVVTAVTGGELPDGGGLDGAVPDGVVADVIPLDAGPPCTDFAVGLGTDRMIEVLDGLLLGEGAMLTDVEVEEPGQVVLARSPYRYGAVLVTGYDDPLLAATPAFSDLAGATPRLRGLRDSLRGAGAAGTPPHGLALDDDGSYTIVLEGEVCLAAGVNNVSFQADDRGRLEIPGYLDLVQTTPGAASDSFTATTEGFHPIRIAYSNESGSGAVSVDITSIAPGSGSCGVGSLRVDVSAVEGRDAAYWPSRTLDSSPWGSRIDTDDSDQRFGNAAYPDSRLPSADNWSLRLVGRHTLPSDLAALNVSSDEGHRIWVDGVFLGGVYGGGRLSGVYELPLRGRRDFVVELEEGGGDAEITYTIGGAPFPVVDARPVTAFGGAPWGVGSSPNASIGAGSSRMEVLTLLSPSAPASALEVSAIIEDVTDPTAVDVTVVTPTAMSTLTTLANAARPAGTPLQWIFHRVIDFGASRPIVAGAHQLVVANRTAGTIRWARAGILAHLDGKVAAYPTSGMLVTAPRTYRDEVEVRSVVADVERPPGTEVALAIRAGSTPAQVETAPWVDVMPDGTVPVPQRGRVLQLRATLSGDGTATPRLRDVRLHGHRCRRCEAAACPEERTSDGLVALYTFEEGAGDHVLDRSGSGTPLDLRIWRTDRVSWEVGAIAITDDTIIAHDGPPARLYDALVASDEITIEAWAAPENVSQSGPARIVAAEHGVHERNFAIGQDREQYEVRLRRDDRDMPYFTSPDGVASTDLTQIVFVRGGDSNARLWVDGEPSTDPADATGAFDDWRRHFTFALGNSPPGLDRPWHGRLVLVAVYDRALTDEEISRHFTLGGRLSSDDP